jgi:type I site-specific restriction endonuclease
MPETPEQRARHTIDALLGRCGWTVQDKNAVNLSAARGVAVSELSFKTGEPDYTLFVDGKALGTVEAKPEGTTPSNSNKLFPGKSIETKTALPVCSNCCYKFAEQPAMVEI